jgi:hypothetical protein
MVLSQSDPFRHPRWDRLPSADSTFGAISFNCCNVNLDNMEQAYNVNPWWGKLVTLYGVSLGSSIPLSPNGMSARPTGLTAFQGGMSPTI